MHLQKSTWVACCIPDRLTHRGISVAVFSESTLQQVWSQTCTRIVVSINCVPRMTSCSISTAVFTSPITAREMNVRQTAQEFTMQRPTVHQSLKLHFQLMVQTGLVYLQAKTRCTGQRLTRVASINARLLRQACWRRQMAHQLFCADCPDINCWINGHFGFPNEQFRFQAPPNATEL